MNAKGIKNRQRVIRDLLAGDPAMRDKSGSHVARVIKERHNMNVTTHYVNKIRRHVKAELLAAATNGVHTPPTEESIPTWTEAPARPLPEPAELAGIPVIERPAPAPFNREQAEATFAAILVLKEIAAKVGGLQNVRVLVDKMIAYSV